MTVSWLARSARERRDDLVQEEEGGQIAASFQSDWSTATGTTENAYLDGGKWDVHIGQGPEVIANPGNLGFPATMANLYKANALAVNSGANMLHVDGITLPATPCQRWYRIYFRPVKPADTADLNDHMVQDGGASSSLNWAINFNQLNDTEWQTSVDAGKEWRFVERTNPARTRLIVPHTYRLEIMIDHLDDTTFIEHVRIYDESNVLVRSDDDFWETNQHLTLMADSPDWPINSSLYREAMHIGCNGWGALASDKVYGYFGGAAVSDEDWCGEYGNVEGEPTS